MNKLKWMLVFFAVGLIAIVAAPFAAETNTSPSLDDILDRVEKTYAGSGFTADFYQESTLKEMDITDNASGKIFIKRPGRMRWEYREPEKQIIITDSQTLWIYRPEDNQVMTGEAPSYFGEGKGASFLSDMKTVRKNFSINLEIAGTSDFHFLRLVPLRRNVDLAEIYLTISNQNFHILQIITYNSYGDKTVIKLRNFDFDYTLSDDMFRFTPPEGMDVLKMDK